MIRNVVKCPKFVSSSVCLVIWGNTVSLYFTRFSENYMFSVQKYDTGDILYSVAEENLPLKLFSRAWLLQ